MDVVEAVGKALDPECDSSAELIKLSVMREFVGGHCALKV